MPAVTKSAFRERKVVKVHQVSLPEAGPGEYACVRELSATDLVALRQAHGREGDTANLPFLFDVLARTVCDDAGQVIFDGAADCQAHFGLGLSTLERLCAEVLRASGLEVREKNSPPASATS